jgi:hypothetical protein
MKGIVSVALIGGVASAAAIMLPGDAGQAWGPLAALSTGVLLLAAWIVAADDTPAASAGAATRTRAA